MKRVPNSGTVNANVVVWSYDMMGLAVRDAVQTLPSGSYHLERHAKKCEERYCEYKHRAVIFGLHTVRR